MLGLENEYLFDIYVKNQPSIFTVNDLIGFTIVEKYGFAIPYWEVIFTLKRPEYEKYLHKGNILCMKIGKHANTLQDVELEIEKVYQNPSQDRYKTMTIRGFLNVRDYLTTPHKDKYVKSSSKAAIIKAATRNFNVYTNIKSDTTDIMDWSQPNCSDFRFLQKTWVHGDYKNNFVVTGIDMSSTFHLINLHKKMKYFDAKYTFTNSQPENALQYQILNDYYIANNTTMNNLFSSKLSGLHVYDEATGVTSTIRHNGSQLLAEGSSTNMVGTSAYPKVVKTYEMHSTYWQSYLTNMQNIFLNTSVNLWVTIQDRYIDIKPCEVVSCMLKEQTAQSSENLSGIYFVNKIVRNISGRKFTTNILLSRGTNNIIKAS